MRNTFVASTFSYFACERGDWRTTAFWIWISCRYRNRLILHPLHLLLSLRVRWTSHIGVFKILSGGGNDKSVDRNIHNARNRAHAPVQCGAGDRAVLHYARKELSVCKSVMLLVLHQIMQHSYACHAGQPWALCLAINFVMLSLPEDTYTHTVSFLAWISIASVPIQKQGLECSLNCFQSFEAKNYKDIGNCVEKCQKPFQELGSVTNKEFQGIEF